MGNYYDVAFHVLNDRVLVKKAVYSERKAFDAWQDACAAVTEQHLFIYVDDQYITLNRRYIVRTDARHVEPPIDKEMKRKERLEEVVQKFSDMGF